MNISVPSEHEPFIQQRVESGRNRDAEDVIREALDLLSTKEGKELDALRAAIALGDDDIRNGRVTPWTPDLLPRLLREAKEMVAAERRASEHGER